MIFNKLLRLEESTFEQTHYNLQIYELLNSLRKKITPNDFYEFLNNMEMFIEVNKERQEILIFFNNELKKKKSKGIKINDIGLALLIDKFIVETEFAYVASTAIGLKYLKDKILINDNKIKMSKKQLKNLEKSYFKFLNEINKLEKRKIK